MGLEEAKKNITLTTDTPSRPSKEQIINKGFKFHSQGNISEAAKYYQHFINQRYKEGSKSFFRLWIDIKKSWQIRGSRNITS